MASPVTKFPAAPPAEALAHFEARLRLETDCWDVHAALADGAADFVLLDVRSPEAFAAGHVAGAVNLPHALISQERMDSFPSDSTVVVYCAGPHCNGANKAKVVIDIVQATKNIDDVNPFLNATARYVNTLAQVRRTRREPPDRRRTAPGVHRDHPRQRGVQGAQ